MYEVAERSVERTSSKIMDRLRASREEFLGASRDVGKKLGKQWFETSATFEQLERLWTLRDRLEANGGEDNHVLGSAEVFLAIQPDASDIHTQCERFWRETVGIRDDIRRNQPAFLTAFMDAAVGQWPAIREQLADG
jgi:hypothetical protein